jgi:hypothetical protein
MELITTFIGTVAGFVVALSAHFIAHDAYSSAPRYACGLIERAVRALPAGDQARYREEWLADLNERPSVLSKFRHAIECYICARKLSTIYSQNYSALTPHSSGEARSTDLGIKIDNPTSVLLLLALKTSVQNDKIEQPEFNRIKAEVEDRLGPANLEVIVDVSKRLINYVNDQRGAIASIVTEPCSSYEKSVDARAVHLQVIDKALTELGWYTSDTK